VPGKGPGHDKEEEMIIERMDLKGKGKSFRFFSYDDKGELISVKAQGNGIDYADGDNVDQIISYAPLNDAQFKRWEK
jgi:hypothetical protein